jgi:vancomycin permeability regulator SanA
MLLAAIALPAAFFALSAGAIVRDGLTDHLRVADVAIVLASKVEDDGQPSPSLQARLDKAVGLYRQGFFAEIVVSGGIGAHGHDEAKVMQHYLVGQGIPAARIHVDSAGVNTYVTAKNAARFMKEKGMRSAMIISQYFHITRARLALRRFGVSPLYSAHADLFQFRDLYAVPREVVGIYSYLTRTYPGDDSSRLQLRVSDAAMALLPPCGPVMVRCRSWMV